MQGGGDALYNLTCNQVGYNAGLGRSYRTQILKMIRFPNFLGFTRIQISISFFVFSIFLAPRVCPVSTDACHFQIVFETQQLKIKKVGRC
jgi:hypothetical protein